MLSYGSHTKAQAKIATADCFPTKPPAQGDAYLQGDLLVWKELAVKGEQAKAHCVGGSRAGVKPCLWGAAVGVGDVEISEPTSVHTPV